MPEAAAQQEKSDVRPVIPDFDRIFRDPLVRPEPESHAYYDTDFFSRNRNVIWWVIIFLAIGLCAGIMLAIDFSGPGEFGC